MDTSAPQVDANTHISKLIARESGASAGTWWQGSVNFSFLDMTTWDILSDWRLLPYFQIRTKCVSPRMFQYFSGFDHVLCLFYNDA